MITTHLAQPPKFTEPTEIIPLPEQWLWQNPQALALVLKGINQAADGNVQEVGSFAQYADLEIDD